jgi:2-hydroxymuconate-semialdehyde hydrolase
MTATIDTNDITVGHYTFRVSQTGQDNTETIVWLHGSGPGATALSNWEWMIGELDDQYHNVAPDIIGFGDSTHPDPPPQGIKAFTALRVHTLLALLDTLQLDRVHLVGNSMGGMISLSLTQAAPQRIDKLVLMGSGGAPIQLTPGLIKLVTFYDNPTPEAMAQLLTEFVYDPGFFGDRLNEIAAARLPRATRPEVERSHRATFDRSAGPLIFTEDELAAIAHPTLVVHGANDKIVPLEAGQYIGKHLPNAQLEIFDNTGHWLQIEQGPKFAALLRWFLKDA